MCWIIYVDNLANKYQTMNQIIFTYGRFNPPTKGHESLFKKCADLARMAGCDYRIYTSASCDSKSNPLTLEQKMYFLQSFYPNTSFYHSQTVFTACRDLAQAGYDKAVIVLGEDRGQEIINGLSKYVDHPDATKALGLKEISLYEIERAQDSVSATSARVRVREGDYQGFKELIPDGDEKIKRELFDVLKKAMGA